MQNREANFHVKKRDNMISTKSKWFVFLTSVGAGLEYYDFIIYGLLASYLSKIFFPASNPLLALLQTFSIFAIGYLARPVGALILGSLGDRYGRKTIFFVSLIVMAITSLIIGLLPTYHYCQMWATYALILLRIFQGLAFGAELPGTMTFVIEHIGERNYGVRCGLVLASLSIAAMFASLVVYGLNRFLTTEQMLAFGWRIPFLFGSSLAVVSYFIRRRLQETPPFLAYITNTKNKINPIAVLFKTQLLQILIGIGVTLFGACYIIFGVSMPAYLQEFYGYQAQNIYLISSLGFIWSALTLPIMGWVADKIGRIALLLISSVIVIVSGYGFFKLLLGHELWRLFIFIAYYQLIISAIANCSLPLLIDLFPLPIRFTGVAWCYSIAFSLASFTPMILTRLAIWKPAPLSASLFFTVLAFSTIVATLALIRLSAQNMSNSLQSS